MATGTRRHRVLKVVVLVYLFLWVATAIWGTRDVSREFDRQFAYGYAGSPRNLDGGGFDPSTQVPIDRLGWANVRDPFDPMNSAPAKGKAGFRYKSAGMPVAPFLILDDVAAIWSPLSGFGATRLNFWFFGYTHWWRLVSYWDA